MNAKVMKDIVESSSLEAKIYSFSPSTSSQTINFTSLPQFLVIVTGFQNEIYCGACALPISSKRVWMTNQNVNDGRNLTITTTGNSVKINNQTYSWSTLTVLAFG